MAESLKTVVGEAAEPGELMSLKRGIKVKQNFPGSNDKKKYSGGLSFNKTTIATLNKQKVDISAPGKMDAEAYMEAMNMDRDVLSS